MSVDISCLAAVDRVLRDYPDHCLAGFSTEQARSLDQGVARDPLPDNPAHSAVFDQKGHRSKSVQRALAKLTVWVIPPS